MQSATVAGSVLRFDTGEPLKKARITVQSHSDPRKAVYDLTDDQGHFSIDKLEPGAYRLTITRSGYVAAEFGQKKIGGSGAVLNLNPGQQLTDLVFKLAGTAALSGHVYDEDGEPIRNANFTVFRTHGPQIKASPIGAPVATNDLGEFRVFDLPPGRYLVSVFYHPEDDFPPRSKPQNPTVQMGYLPSFYPNTTDAAKAQAIAVHAGDDLRTLDFFLRPAPLVAISGKIVVTVPHASTDTASVFLYPGESGPAQSTMSLDANTDAKTGDSQIQNVPPGSYYIGASFRDGDSGIWLHTTRELEVGNSNVDGLTLVLLPGIDVAGRLSWEGSPPRDLGRVHIRLAPVDKTQPGSQGQVVKADGTFVLKNVPEGQYRVEVLAMGTNARVVFLKSARYGTTAVKDAGLTVPAGSDAALELLMSTRVAQISGTVLTSDSLPAVGAQVILVPVKPRHEFDGRPRSENTDQYGKFTISGIEPGDYKLFSWDSVEDADWFDPEWLKPFEDKGLSIHLEEADQKAVELSLIEAAKDPSTIP